MSATANHPYYQLRPERVLDAIESLGLEPDNRLFALNSYENRVYQVGLHGAPNVIVKFYRPGRWSDEQILEEHSYLRELVELEVPVVAPSEFNGKTLLEFEEYRLAAFPQCLGRTPELDQLDNLLILGRFIARVHAVGSTRTYAHRHPMSLEWSGRASQRYLLENDFIPQSLVPAYESLSNDLIGKMQSRWDELDASSFIRLHGDCHPGNILWREDSPNFVDFDDSVSGPAIQDLWMLLSGDRNQRLAQLSELADGYNEFANFPVRQLELIETLRTMRLMYYSAWLARRWSDPAFPLSFPWFNTERYWGEHLLELREQMSALDEPALSLF